MPIWEFEPGGGVGIAEFIARLHREKWEPVRKALPATAVGPAARARLAIELLVEAASDVACRPPEDEQRASLAKAIDGALRALTGRGRESIARWTLVRQIEHDAAFELLRNHASDTRRFYEAMWPEYPVGEAEYREAVRAWLEYEQTKRGNKWTPVLEALKSAGLANGISTQDTLEREMREWKRDRFFAR